MVPMKALIVLVMMTSATIVWGQRPSYAGTKPIGFPELDRPDPLGNRFGEKDGTTERLPVEALGDRDLVDRLSKLPVDKQPFWFINWQALEANRQNPQTYPQRPSPFNDPIVPSNEANNAGTVNAANTNLEVQTTVMPNNEVNNRVNTGNSGVQASAVPSNEGSNGGTGSNNAANTNLVVTTPFTNKPTSAQSIVSNNVNPAPSPINNGPNVDIDRISDGNTAAMVLNRDSGTSSVKKPLNGNSNPRKIDTVDKNTNVNNKHGTDNMVNANKKFEYSHKNIKVY